MNIWTDRKQSNGTGSRAIITQRVRVQSRVDDVTRVITWPACLDELDADELAEIVDGAMILAAQKKQIVDDGQAPRRRVAGVLVSDPGFWQRARAKVGL